MGGLVVDEALFATAPLIGESRVVQAKEVQQGGVVIVVVHHVLYGVMAPFVGGAVDVAGLEAAAGQPHGKAVGVMVASGAFFVLHHGQPAHLAAPMDDRAG